MDPDNEKVFYPSRGGFDFFGQFRIGNDKREDLRGFNHQTLNGLPVETHETLPHGRIIDGRGRHVGTLIGELISLRAGCILTELSVEADFGTPTFWAQIESVFDDAHGSYLAVIHSDGYGRIYLDADGTISLVYSSQNKVAASTTGLILDRDDYLTRFRRNLFRRLDVLGEGWFPSGMTAHEGVHRLLCNFYLELPAFRPVRHWPLGDFPDDVDLKSSAEEVAARTSRAIEILLNEGRLASSLTAGNETRFLLAAARGLHDRMRFFTVGAKLSARDVAVARKLSEQFGFAHQVLPLRRASLDEQEAWLFRASHSIGGSNRITHPSVWPLGEVADRCIGGLGGEIGRAFFWRPSDTDSMTLSPRDIVARFGMPIEPEVVLATELWADGVRAFRPLTKLDLAYLELRMSAWGFAQTYTQPVSFRPVHPLISRRVFEIMLSQPPAVKRANMLLREAIRQVWPELLKVPINKYGDLRDLLFLAQRVGSLKRIRKKLIKMFG